MERTEEEYYNESRRLREETMLMADALRDKPLRFTITNGISAFAKLKTQGSSNLTPLLIKKCLMQKYKT